MTTVDGGRPTLGGRYELQQLIARGGMGEVWRGRDTMLSRPVAVKVLRSEYADDPTFLARFRAEARHAAALSHPNIATVLDYGEGTAEDTGEHVAFLVMELVDGAPLSRLLSEEGPMDPDAALAVLSQAAAALAEAHRAGVVHRDVKPGNILVRTDGSVKLTDFGIAWSAASAPLTGTGQVIGTPQYMSPEQAAGERVSPASDVYALGLVGYESLTGHPAFEGTNPVTVALKHVREDPDPLPADVPPDVRHLIDAALAKDPQERLQDGNAFLHAIGETVHRAPGSAPPTRPVASAAVAVPPAAERVRTTARRRSGEGAARGRPLLVALAVLAVLLLGGGAIVLVGGLGDDGGTVAAPPPSAEPPTSAAPSEAGLVLAAADYVGRPVEQVAAELTGLGLTVGRQAELTPGTPPGTVTALDPAGTEVQPGDRVEVTVAAAPPRAPEAGAVPPAPAGDAPAGNAPDADPAPGPGPATDPPPTGDSAPAEDPAPADDTAADGESAPSRDPAPSEDPVPSEEPVPTEPAEPTEPIETAEPTGSTDGSGTAQPSGASTPTDGGTGTGTPGESSGSSSSAGGSSSPATGGDTSTAAPEPTDAGSSGAAPTT